MKALYKPEVGQLAAPADGINAFASAIRVHHALTARLEKRVLTWIAHRTPEVVHPDHLTALALIAQVCAGAAYAASSRDTRCLWLVSLFLFLNWLGDSLDGTLARVRNRQRPRYGFYVDHIADTFGAFCLMIGLGWSGLVHWQIATGMLVAFYALSIESFLATYTSGRFHLSHGLFGPTEIRILLIVANAVAFWMPNTRVAGHNLRLFDAGGGVAIGGMGAMVITAAIRQTHLLYVQETQL